MKIIKHNFVFIEYLETLCEEEAIVDIKLELSKENLKPRYLLKEGYICEPVPIDLYTGV